MQLILIIGFGLECLNALLLPVAVPIEAVHERLILAPIVAHRCQSARSTHRCCLGVQPHARTPAHHARRTPQIHGRERERGGEGEGERERERESTRASERASRASARREDIPRQSVRRTRAREHASPTHSRYSRTNVCDITHTTPARLASRCLENE